jgi:hypothetical protein
MGPDNFIAFTFFIDKLSMQKGVKYYLLQHMKNQSFIFFYRNKIRSLISS